MIKLSRTKVDLFVECQRCFYLSEKHKISRPSSFPLTLNLAIDQMLKNEFDEYREIQYQHPIAIENNLNLIPFAHEKLNEWRNNKKGIRYYDPNSDIELFGAIDDVWINPETKKLYIVDYKATSTQKEITLDDEWKDVYKRQIEIYQWLFFKNGFDISNEGYFLYANGKTNNFSNNAFKFDMILLKYIGDWDWIESTLMDIKSCLDSDNIPEKNANCKYCNYYDNIKKLDNEKK
jgi:hypothetical protein